MGKTRKEKFNQILKIFLLWTFVSFMFSFLFHKIFLFSRFRCRANKKVRGKVRETEKKGAEEAQ